MRQSIFTLLGLTTALLLAGCSTFDMQGSQGQPGAVQPPAPQTPAPQTPAPAPVGNTGAPLGDVCNVQGAQWAVGQAPTARVTEEARVRSGSYMARVLRPGQVTTKELDPRRLNLELDAGGKIIAARCG